MAFDKQNDIALLEIDEQLPTVSFRNTDKCEIGQTVISVSTPISAFLRGTYSKGLITNLDIAGFGTQRLIQTENPSGNYTAESHPMSVRAKNIYTN